MKKLTSALLALLLVLSLCACGTTGTPGSSFTPDASPEPTPIVWYSKDGINITEQTVDSIINGQFETPKNVIFIIGDGMGPNDIEIAQKHSADAYSFGLVLNKIKNHGLSTTRSANSSVTDSAASATALSTGVKTNNGFIAKDVDGNDLKTMAEIAREQGKRVGIITNEYIHGATPSSFGTHNISRNNTAELVNGLFAFRPDVLMGTDFTSTYNHAGANEKTALITDFAFAANFDAYEYALTADPDCKKPFIGFNEAYSKKASDNLAQCAQVAFNRLKNDNGFFLMIESAGTDKYGHSNDMIGKIASVVTLDRTVAAALLFMQENPDTLLVITSDHETGGVQLPKDGEAPTNDLFTSTSHTATDVRVFAVGKGSEYFKDKTVDNTDIAKFLIDVIKAK